MATPRVTIDALPEQATPEDANWLVVQDDDTTKKLSIATLKTLESTALAAHLSDASDVHAASAISSTDSGEGIDSPTVQGQLGQLASALIGGSVAGPPGPGVAAGGATGQVLAKNSATDYDTEWIPAPTGGGGTGTVVIEYMTQAAYDAIAPGDPGTLYVITDGQPGVPAGGATGEVLAKNSATDYDTEWIPAPSGGSGISDGDKGEITVASSGASWTIDADVVTNAKLANMAASTIKGRSTTGTGDPEDLTVAQLTALVNTFTAALKGAVPPPTTATGKFLKDNGTWDTPAGGGGGTVTKWASPTAANVGGGAPIHALLPGQNFIDATAVNLTLAAGTMYAYPWIVPFDLTLTEIGVYIHTSAASSTVRLGLVAATADWAPVTTGVVNFGSGVDTSTTGGKFVTGLSTAITAGRYFRLLRAEGGAPVTHGPRCVNPVGAVGFGNLAYGVQSVPWQKASTGSGAFTNPVAAFDLYSVSAGYNALYGIDSTAGAIDPFMAAWTVT